MNALPNKPLQTPLVLAHPSHLLPSIFATSTAPRRHTAQHSTMAYSTVQCACGTDARQDGGSKPPAQPLTTRPHQHHRLPCAPPTKPQLTTIGRLAPPLPKPPAPTPRLTWPIQRTWLPPVHPRAALHSRRIHRRRQDVMSWSPLVPLLAQITHASPSRGGVVDSQPCRAGSLRTFAGAWRG